MNLNRSTFHIVALVALVVAASAAAAGAADLQLDVQAERAEVVAGAPVFLTVTLAPHDPDTQAAVHAISPRAGNVQVYIERLGRSPRTRYLGPQWGIDEAMPARTTVTAHDPHEAAIVLLHHNVIEGRDDLAPEALPFEPGRYRITVEYTDVDGRAEGSAIVTVRAPETPAERAYWRAMHADPALAESLQVGNFGRHEDVLGVAEALLAQHPDAPQSALTALAIAGHHLHVRHDAARAEDVLTSFASQNVEPMLRGNIQRELAAALIAQEKFDEAKTTIERALPMARDHQLAADLRALRQALRTARSQRSE